MVSTQNTSRASPRVGRLLLRSWTLAWPLGVDPNRSLEVGIRLVFRNPSRFGGTEFRILPILLEPVAEITVLSALSFPDDELVLRVLLGRLTGRTGKDGFDVDGIDGNRWLVVNRHVAGESDAYLLVRAA